MKNILFFTLLVFGILGAQSVSASCKSDFALLQNKKKVALKPVRKLELKSKKDFKKLHPAELRAVSNYVTYLNFNFDGDNSLFITNAQYQSKENSSSLGHRILVTDGGDESNVTYYIKINVGSADVTYPILYRSWSNQSPERDFLCETL